MNRCEHGVYLPPGETKSPGCQSCYPHGRADEKVPKFNRRGALNITSTGKLPKCPNCQATVPASENKCVECGLEFQVEAAEGLRANNKQPGICPECSSGIHFETGNKKEWECADCGARYEAPRKQRK